MSIEFEWDEDKAAKNVKKHGDSLQVPRKPVKTPASSAAATSWMRFGRFSLFAPAPPTTSRSRMSEGTMRRRPLQWLGILLAIGLVFAFAIPTSHDLLIGLLQNEAFYDGKPTNYWVSALKKRGYFGPWVPCDVGNSLSKAGAAAVPVLVDMLQDEDEDVRVQALFALSAMRPGQAAAAVSALENTLLNEKVDHHLGLACQALVKANEETAIRALIGILESRETMKSRSLAAAALGTLGPRARAAVEALRVALDDEDLRVRVLAAEALWHIERQVNTRLLLTLAQGEDRGYGRSSMRVWKELGTEAQAAVPGVLQALRSPDETIRRCATIALGHLGETLLAKEAVWALVARLNDSSIAVRRDAALALGRMGPKASAAVPLLIEALRDMDRDTHLAAASALGDIGPAASTAVPHLGRAVKDGDVAVRRTAAYALGRIGPAAKAAVPDLIEALKDKDEYTRSSAAQALGRIGPVALTVIPGLIAALRDKSFDVRRDASYALAEIGLAQVQIP
jgi:HEAT repeat protein